MRDTAERLATATDTTVVAEAIADHAARTIGYGSFSFVPFLPGLVDPAASFVRSSEFPPTLVRRSISDMLVTAERELGGLAALASSGPGSFDLADRFPPSRVETTSVFQDYWRPLKLERQLVTLMGPGAEPLGYFCIARSARERAFKRSHLRVAEDLRAAAERSLAAIRCVGSADLAWTLDALARAFPSPAFLFDVNGRLRWLSDDGALRLSIESARVGSSRLMRGNALLVKLAGLVTGLVRSGTPPEERLLHADGVLRQGERITISRFERSEGPLLLVAFESPAAALISHRAAPAQARIPKLGVVESQVARLAAEGYAVLNIASRLTISESTVRTHLRRVYIKCGVHNRAELACALMQSSESRPDRESSGNS